MGNGLLQFGSTEFNLVHNWSGSNAEIGLVIRRPFFISILKADLYNITSIGYLKQGQICKGVWGILIDFWVNYRLLMWSGST